MLSLSLERALRASARWHHGQNRKGDATLPYVAHVVAVALILDRLGFDQDTVIAGLLHDVIEDRAIARATVEAEFGPTVASIVDCCSEQKCDAEGRPRPWLVRKSEYLDRLATAAIAARAVALADKLHNMTAILLDLESGRDVWTLFNAGREPVLLYYHRAIELCDRGDSRLETLATECRRVLEQIESWAP